MPPAVNARKRVVLALASALAGGGLGAAGLAGPLAQGAMAEGTPAAEGAPTSTTAQETTTQTTPATTPEPAPAATTPASTTPATTTTTPTSTAPASSTPAPATPQPATPVAEPVPTVVLQRPKKQGKGAAAPSTSATKKAEAEKNAPNNVAGSPQQVAQEGALQAVLASAQTSAAALEFYRIPLFLLPIYKAAAVQYGVPWQILAAINEIETDYGMDQSVSSAGAVGWMQFMPATWLQYGVDALNAGYADPYNPVDAVFAAARYLRAAGAQTDLRGAILAYNHSEEYADSVLLRAKLISTYPKLVIATLTGLVDGVLPVTGHRLSWTTPSAPAETSQSPTAGATPVSPQAAASAVTAPEPGTPGSSSAPAPTAAAADVRRRAKAAPRIFSDLTSSPDASVVAVQSGRIAQIGRSASLGDFIVLRDVYGDVFTYAGLGSIAKSFSPAADSAAPARSPVVEAASSPAPTPSQPASAGIQTPVTLVVSPQSGSAKAQATHGAAVVPDSSGEAVPAGMGKVRLFAHPGNPDAKAAVAVAAVRRAGEAKRSSRQPLKVGAVVPSGTILGRVSAPAGDSAGHLRFAVRPAGDAATIDPAPILENWAELQTALHPSGAKATNALLGATASDVLLLSHTQLERTVLTDPGITLGACERQDVAEGRVDSRVLAVLAFLSRSGLKPTADSAACGQASAAAEHATRLAIDITAINGVSLARHQGPGTIGDLTIRTLLALPANFVPGEITSLMRYPGHGNTHAKPAYWNRIHLAFAPPPAAIAPTVASVATSAHSATTGSAAPSPIVTTASPLTTVEWNQLVIRVAAIPAPKVSAKPSSSAIPDHPGKRGG